MMLARSCTRSRPTSAIELPAAAWFPPQPVVAIASATISAKLRIRCRSQNPPWARSAPQPSPRTEPWVSHRRKPSPRWPRGRCGSAYYTGAPPRLIAAREVDPVLGPFQLHDQVAEGFGRLGLRISLNGRNEPAQRRVQLRLGGLERRDLLRIVEIAGVERDLGCAGPRFGDPDQDSLFDLGGLLGGPDNVRNEV